MAKLVSVLCLLFVTTLASNDLKLHQLNVVFRHGDRNPETFPKRFPNDPNMHDSLRPFGSGGLTNTGKMRSYHLGKVLRQRYGDFLGPDYAEDRLLAISSDVSRTKMSLLLVLAALYPPTPSTRWNDQLNWQPIPYQYLDFKVDPMFSRDKCEVFIEEYDKVYHSSEVQEELNRFKTYLDELRVRTGKNSSLTSSDVILLHNNLDIERRLNLTMEPWMVKELKDGKLSDLRKLYYKIWAHNDKLKRIAGGYMLRRFNEDMLKARNKTRGYEDKVSLYSCHDKNIIDLLQSLDVYDSHFPEFGSALIFELLSQNEKYYVKISYYLGIPEVTKSIAIPNCETLCPLDKFLSLTKRAETLDEEMECVKKTASYFTSDD